MEQRNLSQGDVEVMEEKLNDISLLFLAYPYLLFFQKNFCKIFFIHDLLTGAQKNLLTGGQKN